MGSSSLNPAAPFVRFPCSTVGQGGRGDRPSNLNCGLAKMDQEAHSLRRKYDEMAAGLTPNGRKPNTPLANVRYERFCHEVAAGRPMHEAAVMARILKAEGKNLKANARRLALRPEVRERIAELAAQAAELASIHGGWVLETLARQARASLADIMMRDETGKIVTDGRGEPKYDFRNASPDALANIREIEKSSERNSARSPYLLICKSRSIGLAATSICGQVTPWRQPAPTIR